MKKKVKIFVLNVSMFKYNKFFLFNGSYLCMNVCIYNVHVCT